ncbi:anaerobic ribonucleoside-triphosphate reductase activating protein [Candidatus Aerophobetes bacterium]|uniref:Anaerobic ribonucleoside-triphosphate reductase activating protein n=1 Tax=Aerophobetes bacterium TaxID=2030807 RepID=A0A523RSY6_UNCAE|nr:MAG: anaerobic ribonucleoside-triphosphate reductase activating protein [Candidatus Aerophobetes bacterium]
MRVNRRSSGRDWYTKKSSLWKRNSLVEFKGFIKTSLIEYPGKIVSVIFTAGCNFRCPFCQNPDLVLSSGSLSSISEKEIIDHLVSKKKWLDGLAITGGEPMIHKNLPPFVRKIKERGFLVEIETNGTNPEMLRSLIEDKLVDFIALDIKAPLEWKRYKEAAEINRKDLLVKVKESVEILLKLGHEINYEFRTTVVPQLLDKEDILEIARQIKEGRRYILQQFLPDKTLDKRYEEIKPYSKAQLEEMREKAGNYVKEVSVRA